MRPGSLSLLQTAARINPHVTIAALAADPAYGEAMVDVFCETSTGGAKSFSPDDWDTLLDSLDEDTTLLGAFMDSAPVRALIRAQEAPHATA